MLFSSVASVRSDRAHKSPSLSLSLSTLRLQTQTQTLREPSATSVVLVSAGERRCSRRSKPMVESIRTTTNMTDGEGSMDILVMLEENPEHSPVLAHVNSVPSPLDAERPSRDIVTIYGSP